MEVPGAIDLHQGSIQGVMILPISWNNIRFFPMVLLLFALAALTQLSCSSESKEATSNPSATSQSNLSSSLPTPTSMPTALAGRSSPAPVGATNTQVPASGSKGEVNEQTYDPSCMEPILGRTVTDDLVYRGRPATPEELDKIADCKLHVYQDKESRGESGENDGRDSRDDGGRDSRDDDQGRGSTFPPSDQQQLLTDWGPQPPLCEGYDKDDSGMPIGPQCNVVPAPLPSGVTKGTLLSAKLPTAKYETPGAVCQTYQGETCSELQWQKTSDLQAGEFVQIRISQTDPNIMYAGTDSNDMTTYRSTDGGDTWELVHITGHAAGVAISPVDSNIALYTNLEAPVQRTDDGGQTWSSVVGNEPGSAHYNNPFTAISFSEDHPNIVYTAALRGDTRGGIWPAEPADIFKSTDSGITWQQTGTCNTCSSVQTIIVKNGNPNFIWVAADGGLQYSEDSGKTWSGNVIPYLKEVEEQSAHNNYEKMPKVIGLAAHRDRPDLMLAASSEFGIFRSTNAGLSWEHSNEGLETSKLHQVHFAPSNPNVAYLSTHHGLYRSDDGGQSWTKRSDGLNYEFVSPIAIHPGNENIVFVGTTSEIYTIHPEHMNRGVHDGHGMYKSVDGGIQWELTDTGITEAKPAQIGTHPILPFNVWVGGESGRGNLFSPDGGHSWLFSPSITSHYPMVYAFNHELPTVIYATGWLRTGELTASTDDGASWYTLTHKLNQGLSSKTKELGLRGEGPTDFHIHGLAVSPSDPNVIYVGSVHDTVYPNLTFNLDGAHIWKSSDRGETFPEMSNGFPIETKTSINSIIVHPENPDVAYLMTSLHETETAIGIYKTTDGANSWVAVNDGLDPHTNDLQMDPINPQVLYAATESGIYKTVNGAESWGKASSGIAEEPVIDMAIDPLNPLVLYAITPENVYRTRDGADNWYPVNLGLPLLADTSKTLSAQERLLTQLKMDRTKTAHSMYGATFAQDRTLEVDATGRVIVVVTKTNRSDQDRRNERILHRAVLTPLVNVTYEFSINDPQRNISEAKVKVVSQSNVYDMFFNSNNQELQFTAAGPPGSESKTTVVIPGSLLSGGDHALDCCIKVFVDGRQVTGSSTDAGVTFQFVHNGRSEVVITTT
ncbi:hypothetical protein FIM12_01805 [SAR202 cluster bacterium AD-804-J14_MRT_500m]|nr:hypothetical protein [SAR202 cluster bacterium AD-804-J14_MRT_500m]